MRRAWPFLLGLAAAGCMGTDSFDPMHTVDSLRVLAVRADLPIARPGETVSLEALVADPLGPRNVTFAWGTCIDPGTSEVPACSAAATGFARGGPLTSITVPPDILDGLPADVPYGMVGVVFAACAGTLTLVPSGTAPVTCTDASGHPAGRKDFMWGEKRVLVTALDVREPNPSLADIHLDGMDWPAGTTLPIDACPGSGDCPEHKLEIFATQESSAAIDGVPANLYAFFFSDGGGLADDFVSADATGAFTTNLDASNVDPGDTQTLWVVLRDGRGGVDWATRSFRIR